ncbi:MAG: hypothetical protein ACRENE_04095 [Polyangiaceae bacterium]
MSAEAVAKLSMRVTEAIFRAEHETPDSPRADAAYRLVSELEEQLGELLPADQLQGALARVGAVTAALRANDSLRAAYLADLYALGAPVDLAEQLRELAKEADQLSFRLPEPQVRPVPFELHDAA